MHLDFNIEQLDFSGKRMNADKLEAAVSDPNAFYRFRQEAETIEIERYEIKDVEQLVK